MLEFTCAVAYIAVWVFYVFQPWTRDGGAKGGCGASSVDRYDVGGGGKPREKSFKCRSNLTVEYRRRRMPTTTVPRVYSLRKPDCLRRSDGVSFSLSFSRLCSARVYNECTTHVPLSRDLFLYTCFFFFFLLLLLLLSQASARAREYTFAAP